MTSFINYEDAINYFKPIFKLHPKEKYFPIDIDYALSACELYKDDKKVLSLGDVNQKTLVKHSNNLSDINNLTPNYWTYLKVADKSKIYGQLQDIDKIPIYSVVNEIIINDARGERKRYWDIIYYTMYLWNGPISVSPTEGVHEWDFETIVVRIDPTKGKKREAIKHVFLSQHSSGVWLKPEMLQFDKDNVIVYVAKYSHAHYPKSKYWIRLFGFAGDKTSDNGITWKPSVKFIDLSERRTGSLLWTHYNGKLKKDGQTFPHFRSWIVDTVNSDLYHESTIDLISKKLGDKRHKIGLGLIIIGLILLIVSIAFGLLNFWTIILMGPITAALGIGINVYAG